MAAQEWAWHVSLLKNTKAQAQCTNLECGLWTRPEAASRLPFCLLRLMRRPQTIAESQSPEMAIPQRFPPISILPPLPLRAPYLTAVLLSLAGKIKRLRRNRPSPSSHMLFPSHLYSDVHGRADFVNFGCRGGNEWPPCGEKFVRSLSFYIRDRRCESTFT